MSRTVGNVTEPCEAMRVLLPEGYDPAGHPVPGLLLPPRAVQEGPAAAARDGRPPSAVPTHARRTAKRARHVHRWGIHPFSHHVRGRCPDPSNPMLAPLAGAPPRRPDAISPGTGL